MEPLFDSQQKQNYFIYDGTLRIYPLLYFSYEAIW